MMAFRKKILIYQDKVGNKMFEDIDQRLILTNKMGKLVNPKEVRGFIKQPSVKQAVAKFYNKKIKFKVLSPSKTKMKGGLYT
jgi:hypothetical protein